MPLDDFLNATLEACALDPDASGCVIAVPAPDVPVERLLTVPLRGVATYWSPAEGASFAGRGIECLSVGASLASLVDEARRTFAGLKVLAHPERSDFAPRLFGGQTFDPTRPAWRDPAWETFYAAAIGFPRWSLSRRNGRCTLAVTLSRARCTETRARRSEVRSLRDEIARVLAALDAPPAALPDRPRATADRDAGRRAWDALVDNALAEMREGRAEKLVAARRIEVTASSPWSLPRVLDDLAGASAPGCVRFAFQMGETAFVGATPERLVSRQGLDVAVDALAGSAPRGATPDEDHARARQLFESAKELREHALVVDGVRASLAPLCDRVDAPDGPAVRTLRNVHHLWTPIRARLRAESPAHALSLVGALHPTPALGGSPRAAALTWIAAHESHPRGWYAGPVGWCDARGDGEFFVSIRSAALRGDRAWVYAGAGLVEGSDADAEWRETDAKMAVMRAALGV